MACRRKDFYYDTSKNWWSREAPEKPVRVKAGHDSEMFWDFGAEMF